MFMKTRKYLVATFSFSGRKVLHPGRMTENGKCLMCGMFRCDVDWNVARPFPCPWVGLYQRFSLKVRSILICFLDVRVSPAAFATVGKDRLSVERTLYVTM